MLTNTYKYNRVTYKTEFVESEDNSPQIHVISQPLVVLAVVAITSVVILSLAIVGLFDPQENHDTLICNVGTYAENHSSTICMSCGMHMTSGIGSISVSNCTCKTGYLMNNYTCIEIPSTSIPVINNQVAITSILVSLNANISTYIEYALRIKVEAIVYDIKDQISFPLEVTVECLDITEDMIKNMTNILKKMLSYDNIVDIQIEKNCTGSRRLLAIDTSQNTTTTVLKVTIRFEPTPEKTTPAPVLFDPQENHNLFAITSILVSVNANISTYIEYALPIKVEAIVYDVKDQISFPLEVTVECLDITEYMITNMTNTLKKMSSYDNIVDIQIEKNCTGSPRLIPIDTSQNTTTTVLKVTIKFEPTPAKTTPAPVLFDPQENHNTLRCNVGTYSENHSSTNCTDCPAGKYNPSQGTSTCISCESGKYSKEGSSECTNCGVGTYAENHSSTNCTDCAVGKYNPSQGTSTCISCDSGKYSKQDGMSICSICAGGTFSPSDSSHCLACTPGTYAIQRLLGSSACTHCSVGTYTENHSSTNCTHCLAGKYNLVQGTSTCISCDSGKYLEQLGMSLSNCVDCPTGKYNNHIQGTSTCIRCGLGSFSRTKASSTCVDCATDNNSSESNGVQNIYYRSIRTRHQTPGRTHAHEIQLLLSNTPTWFASTSSWNKQPVCVNGSISDAPCLLTGEDCTNCDNPTICSCPALLMWVWIAESNSYRYVRVNNASDPVNSPNGGLKMMQINYDPKEWWDRKNHDIHYIPKFVNHDGIFFTEKNVNTAYSWDTTVNRPWFTDENQWVWRYDNQWWGPVTKVFQLSPDDALMCKN